MTYEEIQRWMDQAVGDMILSIGTGNFRSTAKSLLITAVQIGGSEKEKAMLHMQPATKKKAARGNSRSGSAS